MVMFFKKIFMWFSKWWLQLLSVVKIQSLKFALFHEEDGGKRSTLYLFPANRVKICAELGYEFFNGI